jgi:nickel-dependent lactate racemase
VFSGDLEAGHLAAVEHLRSYVTIAMEKKYDVVITQCGDVGINHYQCVKAAFEASRVVKRDGCIIIVSGLTDPDPVGNENYKSMLRLACRVGPREYCRTILSEEWDFVPEQWEVQMWSKVYDRLAGPERVYICAPQLEGCPAGLIMETNVAQRKGRLGGESDIDFARRILQETINECTKGIDGEDLLILPDGPYSVPRLGAE